MDKSRERLFKIYPTSLDKLDLLQNWIVDQECGGALLGLSTIECIEQRNCTHCLFLEFLPSLKKDLKDEKH